MRTLLFALGLALAFVLSNPAPSTALIFDATATTTSSWNCSSPHSARIRFRIDVKALEAEPAWYNEIIDFFAFIHKSCDFTDQLDVRFGSFQIKGGNSFAWAPSVTLPCSVQARSSVFAHNRGYGPGTLSADVSSFCSQPCAPSICHPDACDTIY